MKPSKPQPTRDEQRVVLREKLLKELLGSPTKKRRDKQPASLCKKPSARSKFLANPHNRPEPGDAITFMPAIKKKPKV